MARRVRLGAAALLAAAALGLPGVPAHARTVTPTHVAIVVDGVGSECVPWQPGMTGADVLRARFRVQWGQWTPGGNYAGMVVQINDDPAVPNPHTAYWAYFHDTGSGWQYAGRGALSSRPEPGTVEGWRLDSASDPSSHPAPAPASYAAICAGQDRASTPPARHTTSPARATTSSAPAHTSEPAAAKHSMSSSRSHSVAATHARRPTSTTPRPATSSAPLASGTPPASSAPLASSAPSRSGVSPSPVALTRHGSGSSAAPAVGTAAALVVVLGLGGAAFWRGRARRGAP